MNESTSIRVLAGDIGGTKTRLAIFDVRDNHLEAHAEETYPSQDHASLRAIVSAFFKLHDELVEAACFGIAGPVQNNTVKTTNLPWHINAAELSERFSIQPVSLLNDLEANAWGIRALQADDFFELYPGERGGETDASGNAAVIAAGTGLGEAGMYFDGESLRPFSTEGGHTDFSPADEQQIELLRFLGKKYQHVSW